MNELSKKIHRVNVLNGFYEDEKNIGEMLALIHSEVSEALEADRNNHYAVFTPSLLGSGYTDEQWKDVFNKHIKGSFEDEIADTIIRLLDLCAFKGINIEDHVTMKLKYNSMRPYKHGKKY